jgi:anti-sigma-K factor RskA
MNEGSREFVENLLPAYALNALDDDERQLVERALEQDPDLRRVLAGYLSTVTALSTSVAPAVPSAALRARVLRQRPVAASPKAARQRLFLWQLPAGAWSAAAVVVIAIGALVGMTLVQQSRIGTLRADVVSANAQIEEQKQEIKSLEQEVVSARSTLVKQRTLAYWAALPGVSTSVISPASSQMPTQTWWRNNPRAMYMVTGDGTSSMLVVMDLPRLTEGLVYQAWFVRRNSPPVSALLFEVDESGYGQFGINPPESITFYTGLAVTIEPAGGSGSPSGELVLAGSFEIPPTPVP